MNRQSPEAHPGMQRRRLMGTLMKFFGGAVGIIFLIGLLVVIGLFALIF